MSSRQRLGPTSERGDLAGRVCGCHHTQRKARRRPLGYAPALNTSAASLNGTAASRAVLGGGRLRKESSCCPLCGGLGSQPPPPAERPGRGQNSSLCCVTGAPTPGPCLYSASAFAMPSAPARHPPALRTSWPPGRAAPPPPPPPLPLRQPGAGC